MEAKLCVVLKRSGDNEKTEKAVCEVSLRYKRNTKKFMEL